MRILTFPSSAQYSADHHRFAAASGAFDRAADAAWSYWEAHDCIDVNSTIVSQRLHGGSLLLAYILAVALVAVALLFPSAPVSTAITPAPPCRDNMLSLQMKAVLEDWNF